ncbi:MAG TPA: hypothetical protein VJU83_06190 [Burkholderiales bacterium]|nr:hypothetical protein [Burkholderiales bacterium]
MSTPQSEDPQNDRYVPPPPSAKRLAIMRFVFAALGLTAFYSVWLITDTLQTGWRFAISVLVAAPFLVIPDLLRDKSAPPPGFKPRKWEDEDDN